jgi:uncharacterized C2H2 Zn-finger protein
MFFENEYVRPLFDVVEGGPPKAFLCIVELEWKNKKLFTALNRPTTHRCGKVCSTEKGMQQHLKLAHGWQEQPCLSSMDNSETIIKNGKEVERKLRVSPSPRKNQQPNTEKKESLLPETNEGELLKLMREEK